jgi:hypothetical protein
MLVNRNYILSIVGVSLFDCKAINAAANLWVSVTLIRQLQDLTALGIVLLYLIPTTKVAINVITTIMTILVVFFTAFVMIRVHYWSGFYDPELRYYMYGLTLKFSAAYYVLLLCAAVCGLLLLLFSLPSLGQEDWLAPVILTRIQLSYNMQLLILVQFRVPNHGPLLP